MPEPPPLPELPQAHAIAGGTLIHTYRLPEGRREALTELMIRDDVPVLVSPQPDGIAVHGPEKQQKIFGAFVKMITRGEMPGQDETTEQVYRLADGKREALTELMIRSDVPVLVSPQSDGILVHGTESDHRVFGAFVKMIHAPDDGRSEAAPPVIERTPRRERIGRERDIRVERPDKKEVETLVREYALPEGRRDALIELMIRDDVPVLVSPEADGIAVHGPKKQQNIFGAFVKMITRDEMPDQDETTEHLYELDSGKREALTELMVRDDVPVLVSPQADGILVYGTEHDHRVFGAFVKMIQSADDGPSVATAPKVKKEKQKAERKREKRVERKREREVERKRERQVERERQRKVERERARTAERRREEPVETLVREYAVPDGRREALTELMIRSDVPVLVSPQADGIAVHGPEKQQRIFGAFVKLITRDEMPDRDETTEQLYKVADGKREALTELMVRSDVPVLVGRHDEGIVVYGTEKDHHIFGAFVKMLHGPGDHRSDAGSDPALERVAERLGQMYAHLDSSGKGIQTLAEAMGRLNEQDDELAARATELEVKAELLEAEAEQLEAEAEALREQGEAVRESAEEIREQADEVREQADELRDQADELRAEAETADDEDASAELMTGVKELEREAHRLDQEAQRIEQKAQQLELEADRIELQAEQVEQKAEQLEEQADKLEEQAEQLEEQAEAAEEAREEAQGDP
jgi:hypothetical protein